MDNYFVPRHEGHTFMGDNAACHMLGYFMNWGLFGILSCQAFLYYLAFPQDKTSIKLLVYGLYALEVVQTALITHDAFIKYGLHFGDTEMLSEMMFAWLSIPLISAIASTAVQLFFAYRIWKLSQSIIIGGLIALLAVASGASGIAVAALSKKIGDLHLLATEVRDPMTLWLILTAACDLIVAICMTYFLSKKKSGFSSVTDDAITKIIRVTVETGSATAFLAVLTAILFLVFPDKAFWNVPIDVLGKLYSNNLLVIFNRRIHISGGRNDFHRSMDNAPVKTKSRHQPESSRMQTLSMTNVPIRIQTTKEIWTDEVNLDQVKEHNPTTRSSRTDLDDDVASTIYKTDIQAASAV